MIKFICWLEIVLIIAKMAGFTSLSWFWITLPLWIGFVLLGAILLVSAVILVFYVAVCIAISCVLLLISKFLDF